MEMHGLKVLLYFSLRVFIFHLYSFIYCACVSEVVWHLAKWSQGSTLLSTNSRHYLKSIRNKKRQALGLVNISRLESHKGVKLCIFNSV